MTLYCNSIVVYLNLYAFLKRSRFYFFNLFIQYNKKIVYLCNLYEKSNRNHNNKRSLTCRTKDL